ncbi:MAG: hypothetical protein LLG20_16525 [Acidobacteriales bacterium]|nr:hypothetical protein [Terriglobales bacterium]
MKPIKGLLPLAGWFMLLTGCNNAHAPARPEGVPHSAVWAGGVDGGAFVDCSPSHDGGPNPCTVYHDGTGGVLSSGRFVVEGTKWGATADKLQYYGAPDGMSIFLKNHLTLTPLSPERPTSVPETALLGENGVYADCHPKENGLYTCSLYLAASGEKLFSGSYRCASLPHPPCTGDVKYADRDEIALKNAGRLKAVK